MNFARVRFFVLNLILQPMVLLYYGILRRNQEKNLIELGRIQNETLCSYLKYCVTRVPYYRDKRIVAAGEIASWNARELLSRFPVLTKEMIRSDADLSSGRGVLKGWLKTGMTGGSTGSPLKYKMSRKCSSMAQAMLFRGWGYAGYLPGDKIAVLAGGSLVGKRATLRTKIIATVLGFRKYSSYGVDASDMDAYYEDMRHWGARYLRGYVSSIFDFAEYLIRTNRKLPLQAVFTTAEMLHARQRALIEEAFECKVFNTYGLNDGAITAFECDRHDGFHVDMERGLLEILDESGQPVLDKPGRIMATSLLNRGTPFVRYDTGDIGVLASEPCSCGLPFPLLTELRGRSTDSLHFHGKSIGSPVLTVLMSGIDVLRYQFVQSSDTQLSVHIDKGSTYSCDDEDFIRASIQSQVGAIAIDFDYSGIGYVESDGGKWKLVFNQHASNRAIA